MTALAWAVGVRLEQGRYRGETLGAVFIDDPSYLIYVALRWEGDAPAAAATILAGYHARYGDFGDVDLPLDCELELRAIATARSAA